MPTLKTLQIFHGPSPEGEEPTVVVLLNATPDELAGVPASAERLARAFGNWFAPTALPGADLASAGRFVAELARALLNEYGHVLSVATSAPTEDGVRLTVGHRHPFATLRTIETATRLTLGAAKASDKDIEGAVGALLDSIRGLTPDPQAAQLIQHARAQGIPVRPLDWSARLWLFGWGARSEVCFESSPGSDSLTSLHLSRSKPLAKQVAVSAGFRVVPGAVVHKPETLEEVARGIGFPCVTKPLDSGQSRGVTTAIRDLATLRKAWVEAQAIKGGGVLVERHVEGEVHRLMVFHGKFFRAALRARPTVTGDGASTVLELTRTHNAELAKTLRPSSFTSLVPMDGGFEACLRQQGLTPAAVPAAGAKVLLRAVPMLNQGASECIDVTHQVDPELRRAAEQLARTLGAGSLGIDVIATDISKAETCHFLEANLTPGLRVLRVAGVPLTDIGQALLGERPARLPLTLLVAPRASHGRLRDLLPRAAGLGWTDGRAVGLGERTFPTAVRAPQDGVDLLVRNRDLTALAVIADPEDLVANGLPADRIGTTALLDGVTLPTEWQATLERHSDQVVRAQDETSAASLCRW